MVLGVLLVGCAATSVPLDAPVEAGPDNLADGSVVTDYTLAWVATSLLDRARVGWADDAGLVRVTCAARFDWSSGTVEDLAWCTGFFRAASAPEEYAACDGAELGCDVRALVAGTFPTEDGASAWYVDSPAAFAALVPWEEPSDGVVEVSPASFVEAEGGRGWDGLDLGDIPGDRAVVLRAAGDVAHVVDGVTGERLAP